MDNREHRPTNLAKHHFRFWVPSLTMIGSGLFVTNAVYQQIATVEYWKQCLAVLCLVVLWICFVMSIYVLWSIYTSCIGFYSHRRSRSR